METTPLKTFSYTTGMAHKHGKMMMGFLICGYMPVSYGMTLCGILRRLSIYKYITQ